MTGSTVGAAQQQCCANWHCAPTSWAQGLLGSPWAMQCQHTVVCPGWARASLLARRMFAIPTTNSTDAGAGVHACSPRDSDCHHPSLMLLSSSLSHLACCTIACSAAGVLPSPSHRSSAGLPHATKTGWLWRQQLKPWSCRHLMSNQLPYKTPEPQYNHLLAPTAPDHASTKHLQTARHLSSCSLLQDGFDRAKRV
jgi:hypothetical protein